MKSHTRKPIGDKNAAVLRALCHLDVNQRRAVLKTASPKLIKCICECALNLLRGNVPLKHSEKVKLRRHRHSLRKLAEKKGSWKSKKKFVVQKGGFLPLLIGPIIGALLSNLFSSSSSDSK